MRGGGVCSRAFLPLFFSFLFSSRASCPRILTLTREERGLMSKGMIVHEGEIVVRSSSSDRIPEISSRWFTQPLCKKIVSDRSRLGKENRMGYVSLAVNRDAILPETTGNRTGGRNGEDGRNKGGVSERFRGYKKEEKRDLTR